MKVNESENEFNLNLNKIEMRLKLTERSLKDAERKLNKNKCNLNQIEKQMNVSKRSLNEIRDMINEIRGDIEIKESKNEKNFKNEFLEEIAITKKSIINLGNEKCMICLINYSINDKISYLPCFHFFHYSCIKNWIKIKNKCPLCNANI